MESRLASIHRPLSIDMLAYQDLIDTGRMTGPRVFSTGPAVFSFNDLHSEEQTLNVPSPLLGGSTASAILRSIALEIAGNASGSLERRGSFIFIRRQRALLT